MSNTYSAGVATAYGAAVRGGYTGTYAEWCAAMADFGDKSQQAIDAAAQAAQSATDAAGSATNAADSAYAAAASEGNAADSEIAAATSETNAAGSASAAAQSATAAAGSATAAAGSAANAAASAAAAQAVKDSIPADYTELSNDVDDLEAYVRDMSPSESVGPASILSIPDAAPLSADAAVVDIVPVQSGSGDPSPENVRPITGWTEIVVTRSESAEPGVVGLDIDYVNKTFMRLESAAGRTAGADFDGFIPFGGRKRCNVADDGTINAWYGDAGYTEDGSNGQVMVFQPAFYYKREILTKDAATVGYNIRHERVYVSDAPKPGFKLHPAFYDANGAEVDFVMYSAYEGCLYDTSASAYLMRDEQVMDVNADKLSSIAGAKPASGLTQQFTRPNVEKMANNRGANWHGDLIKIESANQILAIIELGMMNGQTAIESGVSGITDNSAYNCSSLTGSTSALGDATGPATSTSNEINGTTTEYNTAGKRAISYRGVENPFGNIWKFVYGINIHGNGSQGGGVPYVCTDFAFAESKSTDNYESAGFFLPNTNGQISAMGYGDEKYDWLFMPSETGENGATSSLPVGDYCYITSNLNGYRNVMLGGNWYYGASCGFFSWYCAYGVGYRGRYVGGRLAYVPTKGTTAHDDAWSRWAAKTGLARYDIAFPSAAGTVYGGTLDLVAGKLSARPYYASYSGETLVGPWVSSMDVYAEDAMPTTGAQVVDLGGSTTDYTLDPVTLTMLRGANTVWADCGDMSLTYRRYVSLAELDELCDNIMTDSDPTVLTWEIGSVSVNTGKPITSTNYIRSNLFKPNADNIGTFSVSALTGAYYYYLFTYYTDGTFDVVQGASVSKAITAESIFSIASMRIVARFYPVIGGIQPSEANNFDVSMPYDPVRLIPRLASVRKNGDYTGSNIYFSVKVNTAFAPEGVVSGSNYDTETLADVPCVLMLPSTYTTDGAPTPLAIFSHGTSGYVAENDLDPNIQTFSSYLVNAGYAVLASNGIPYDSSADRPGMNLGCPMAVQAYHKAVDYIRAHYNVDRQVFLAGSSQGGLAALNFANCYPAEIRAIGLQYPVTDLYNQAWLNPWNAYVTDRLISVYGFSSSEWEAERVLGYNPAETRHAKIGNSDYIFCPVPIKIWHGDADVTVAYSGSVAYINAISNAGIEAHLRTIEGDAHGGDNVYAAYKTEMPVWFNRFM